MQPISTHGGEIMYFGCVCFRGVLGLLNCDDICMCVVNNQFELLELVFKMLNCNMMIFISLLLLGLCPCVLSVVMWSWYPGWLRWLLGR